MKTTKLKTILFTLIYCLAISNTQAADIYWISLAGDWSDGTNWSYDQVSTCNCIPTAADDVFINNEADITITTIAFANSIEANSIWSAYPSTITIGDTGNLTLITSIQDYSFEIRSNWVVSNYGIITADNTTFRGIYVNGGIFNNFGSIYTTNCVNGIRTTSEFNNYGLIQNDEYLYGIVCDGSSYFYNNGTIQSNSSPSNSWFFPTGIIVSYSYFENNGTINIDGGKLGIECKSPFSGNNPTPGFFNKNDGNINISNSENYSIYINTGTSDFNFINEQSASITINGNGITLYDLLIIETPGFTSEGNLTVNP